MKIFGRIFNNKIAKLFLAILLSLIMLNILFPLNKNLYNLEYSKIYYDKDNIPIRMKLSSDGYWRFYTQNKEVPKLLKSSIVTFEDKYFYTHFGINPYSIIRAIYSNITNNIRIGASTITMQVVKIIEPKERSYLNKIIEIFRAIQLEMYLSKEEILNLYLNKAPYGSNIEGLRAAAYFYFGKNLKNLSTSEIAILTTIPKNPNINRPDKQKNLVSKRNRVLDELLKSSLINDSTYIRASKEKISSKKRNFKFDMVQFSDSIIDNKKTNQFTNIDYNLQKYLQKYLKQETLKFNKHKLFNSAAVVIDNKTLEIKAYVASNDFYDNKNGGQNDGILMKKSPGSTLKPFIYALALDQGLITPKRKLLDIPLSFNGYEPKNYDGKFNGEITAEEALKLSLNIPAVDLQYQLKNESLYELLEKVGIGIDNLKSKYGLSIAVGGIDLSLLELTKLYTIFANNGKYKHDGKNIQVFSKEASYLISNILSDGYRENFDGYWKSSLNSKRVAFKTGTSSDAKHLYTIGYDPNYTVGLWFGNFDGRKTSGNLTGTKVVSNSLLEIFNNLDGKNSWFRKPTDLSKEKICIDYFNNDKCTNNIKDFKISDKTICMDLNTQKLRYLSIKQKNNEITKNDCYTNLKQSQPVIISPINEKVYIFNDLIDYENRVLKIECQNYNNNSIGLFLNGKMVENNIYKIFDEGFYTLECIENSNKVVRINFKIRVE